MVANGGSLYLVRNVKANLVVVHTTESSDVKPWIETLFQKEKSMHKNSPF